MYRLNVFYIVRMLKLFKYIVFYYFIRYVLTPKVFIFFSSWKKKKDNRKDAIFLWKCGIIGGWLYVVFAGNLKLYIQVA